MNPSPYRRKPTRKQLAILREERHVNRRNLLAWYKGAQEEIEILEMYLRDAESNGEGDRVDDYTRQIRVRRALSSALALSLQVVFHRTTRRNHMRDERKKWHQRQAYDSAML